MSGGASRSSSTSPARWSRRSNASMPPRKARSRPAGRRPASTPASIPALAFFTTVPFGPRFGEFFAWKKFRGGNKLEQEIYAKHGLISFDADAIGPETSGWFRREITSLDQLKGLKMRFFGLGAQVMQKLGVSTQLLAPPTSFRRSSAA